MSVPAPAASVPLVIVAALLIGLYLFRKRNLSSAARVVGITTTLLTCAAALFAISQLHMAGQWSAGGGTLAGEPLGPGQEWSADLTYNGEDGTVTGQVTVTGSQNVATASFTGTVSGNRVTGALRDAQGNELATIDGVAEEQKLTGQYATPGGASGSFTWNLP